jgi:hypothetical protein
LDASRSRCGSTGTIISPSPSPDAIWPAKSLACQRGGKLQLCYGATASRSPQHSFPKMPEPAEVRLLPASNQGWQPMASFPLRLTILVQQNS